jgi:peptide/nickel transport system substrate-binding protein
MNVRGSQAGWSMHARGRVSIAALLLAVAVTAAACTTDSSSGSTSTATSSGGIPTGSKALTSTSPPATGTLDSITWNLPTGEPTTLDYAKAGDYSPDTLISNMCDYLLRQNPDFTLSPALATKWSNPDPKTLVMEIRQGVTFWDGKPLTAADVVYSLQRNMDRTVHPVNGSFFDNVSSIEQTGPSEVTVHFSKPDELFIKEMATVAGGVAEAAYIKDKGSDYGTAKGGVMCSGPFQLSAWNAGSNIELEKNPDYWDPAYTPKVTSVDIKFIVDTNTLTSGLLSGEIDGSFEVPPVSIPQLESAGVGTLYYGPSLAFLDLAPASKDGPMGNPELRSALSMVIDRQAIASTIFNGAATPNKTMTPPTAWGSDPAATPVYQEAWDALPGFEPDVEGAKAIVAKYPSLASQPITLALLSGDQTEVQVASVVQQAAQSIGLKVQLKELQPLDFSNLFYLPQYREGIDLVITKGFLDVADQLDFLGYFWGPNAFFNWTGFTDKTMESKIDQARSTFDAAERASLLVEAQATYMENMILIPLLNDHEITFMNDRITGAPTSFAYIFLPSFATIGAP